MFESFRALDANINRVCEGIRVLEDYARFTLNDEELCRPLRRRRHEIRKSLVFLDDSLLKGRNAPLDPGRKVSASSSADCKRDGKRMVLSNFKRVQEGLRVIEETLKSGPLYEIGKKIESLRFDFYTLEKEMVSRLKRELPKGIYGITAEKFSQGRSNVRVCLEMAKGGVTTIQYREKKHYKSSREMLKECREIRKITSDYGILFIVNDFVDLALMCDADGVHLGQDDYPPEEARALLGDKIIGLSTHCPDQAERALEQDVDYIGVGPIFGTNIKDEPMEPVGFEYLEYVEKNIEVPYVAIGGIKEHNIKEISSRGAETICLVSEITGADDIQDKIGKLKKITRL